MCLPSARSSVAADERMNMSEQNPDSDIPPEKGPIGKPSQAEGEDGPAPEQTQPEPMGKPSQAEGDVGDAGDEVTPPSNP